MVTGVLMGYIEPTSLRSHASTNALNKVHYEGQSDGEKRLDDLATTVFKEFGDTADKLQGIFQGQAKKLISGQVALTAGSATVTFENPLPTDQYSIILNVDFVGNGGSKPYYTNRTVSGFDIDSNVDATVAWWIVLYS